MNRPMVPTDPTSLDSFTCAYILAALWSSMGDDEQPLDKTHTSEDLAPEALARIVADCAAFSTANEDDIYEWPNGSAWQQAGYDFWLTRNRHGAGFWDGDWPEPQATRLTAAAHAVGPCELYVGDDGRLYVA